MAIDNVSLMLNKLSIFIIKSLTWTFSLAVISNNNMLDFLLNKTVLLLFTEPWFNLLCECILQQTQAPTTVFV